MHSEKEEANTCARLSWNAWPWSYSGLLLKSLLHKSNLQRVISVVAPKGLAEGSISKREVKNPCSQVAYLGRVTVGREVSDM